MHTNISVVWDGKPFKIDRRSDVKYFTACKINAQVYKVGDDIFVNNIESEKSLSGAYIGRIHQLYDKGKGKFAHVNWLLRSFEMSKSATEKNDIDDREVFYSYSNFDNEVKLSSILEKCFVYFMPLCSNPADRLSLSVDNNRSDLWLFFCQRGYDGCSIVKLKRETLKNCATQNDCKLETPKKNETDGLKLTISKETFHEKTPNLKDSTNRRTKNSARRSLYNSEDDVFSTPTQNKKPLRSARLKSIKSLKENVTPVSEPCRKLSRSTAKSSLKVVITRLSPEKSVITSSSTKANSSNSSSSFSNKKHLAKSSCSPPCTPTQRLSPKITRSQSCSKVICRPSRRGSSSTSVVKRLPLLPEDGEETGQDKTAKEHLLCTPPRSSSRNPRARSCRKNYNDNVFDFLEEMKASSSLKVKNGRLSSKKRVMTPSLRLRRKIGENVNSDESSSEGERFNPEDVSSDESDSDNDDYDSDEATKKSMTTPKRKASKRKTSTRRAAYTPQSKNRTSRIVRPQLMTPTVPGRQRVKTSGSLFEQARSRLHVSALPDTMPCREDQFADIYEFVQGRILDNTGGCMYISGVPGTGKTATIHQVIMQLSEEYKSGELPHFNYIEVNAMKLTEPKQAHVAILKQITGQTATADHAAAILDKRFSTADSRRIPTVLLVDELDLLWTNKQTVMYSIFDWPTRKNSKLIVLAVANTMDLPERMMMNRVSSRLGLIRMTFQPYSFSQLQDIVMARMIGVKAFCGDAIQLASRKVAALSGDARRALDICRRATEIAEADHGTIVSMMHVNSALQEMFTSPKIVAIRNSSLYDKLFLKSIVAEFNRNGLEETVFSRVIKQMTSLCRFEGVAPPTASQISKICSQLGSFRLILIENARNDLCQRIRLNISADDVNFALKDMNV